VSSESVDSSHLEDDVLLVLPVRNLVVFPGAVTQVALGREISVAAAREAVNNERKLGLLLQKDPAVDDPGPDDLYRVGTLVSVIRLVTSPNGMHFLICQGEHRFRALDFVPGLPFLAARFDDLREPETTNPEIEALLTNVRSKAEDAIEYLQQAPPELGKSLRTIESPVVLADLVAGLFDFKPAEKQSLLETIDITGDDRYQAPTRALARTDGASSRGHAIVAGDWRADSGEDRRASSRISASRATENDQEGTRRGSGESGSCQNRSSDR
jgi:ATP-dependent Lon protease